MIKLILLLKFKSGMSQKEGISYYEKDHVPLILRTFPGFILDYRRNYVLFDSMFLPKHMEGPPPAPPPFDIITELWFESREVYERITAAMADPVLGDEIARDEAKFLDRTSMTMFLVEEHCTPKVDLKAR